MATKSKFFRVATEGATTDGRAISRDWIEQMARNFDRAKYGARVWLEHYRGIAPDGLFKAYGDVLALQARDVEDGKRALFAQIEPLPELVAMTNAKQKIYTSIEVDPKFAGSGEAYMVGLGVTDSPASLGTEVLQFAQQHAAASPFAGRKTKPENLFSAAAETALEFEEEGDDKAAKFADVMRGIVANMFGKKAATDDARFAAVQAGMEAMARAVTDQDAAAGKRFADLKTAHDKAVADHAALQKQFTGLVARLDQEPGQHTARAPATGGAGAVLTDC
ncbi:MAG: GPO family capsid scaffolding protein [Desulfovibrionaceae bacterium]|nr:GPO family capsid scaffolding protein [Desulfovibrionaceae bacterium]